MSENLAAFLLARWDEDADSVSAYYGGRPPVVTGLEDADPARVLADIEAKRRIVELARDYSPELSSGDNGEWAFDAVLSALAQPFADHPDFQQEWNR